MLFEEFGGYEFSKINNTEYRFNDTKENEYKVFFDGPYPDYEKVETGVTYELEFITKEKDYKILTNAGEPFSVSNFIIGTILKDFIRNNIVDTVVIYPTDVYEDVPRSADKSNSRYKLYLRSANNFFKGTNWEVLSIDNNVLLIDKNSHFWKRNILKTKEKLESLNELKITSNKSSSGRTIELDNILDIPNSNKTLSSRILLRKRLLDEEAFSNDKEIPFGLKREIHAAYLKYPHLSVDINNINFLKDTLKEKKVLRCEYCNKGPLVIYDTFFIKKEDTEYIKYTKFNNLDGATCDHKQPISKGGDKYLYTNLSVCCSRCNKIKKDMSYADWMDNLEHNLTKTLPNRKYKSILQKLTRNRLIKLTNTIQGKLIEFEINKGFEHIDHDRVIRLIIRGQGVELNKISNNKYSVSFKDEEILESSKYLNNTLTLADLFLDISDKYKIKKVPQEDWFASYDKGSLQSHFIIKKTEDEYNWMFRVFISNKYGDADINSIQEDLKLFKQRLVKFGFYTTDYQFIEYDLGYEDSFFIKREV